MASVNQAGKYNNYTPQINKFKLSRRGKKLQVSDDQRTLLALPRDVPERTWAEILQKEENDLLCFDIREEIVDEALKICYAHYMERQNALFTAHCVAQAFMKLIDWEHYRHDPGEEPSAYPPCFIPKRVESWIPDDLPSPSPKDTWCKQDLNVVEDSPDEVVVQGSRASSIDIPVIEPIPKEYWFPGKVQLSRFTASTGRVDESSTTLERNRRRRPLLIPSSVGDVWNVISNSSSSPSTSSEENIGAESEVLQKITDYSTEELVSPKESAMSALKTSTPVDGSLHGAGDSTVGMVRARRSVRRLDKSKSGFSKISQSGRMRTLPPLDGDSRSHLSIISDCRLRNLRAKVRSYAKTVSTGNLNRHLRDVHNIREEIDKTTKNITQFFAVQPRSKTNATSSSSSMIKQKDSWLLARDMALWFCKSLMPFDSVSDEAMNDFFQKYDIIAKKEDMPSRDTVSRTALDDVYESMLKNVKAQIKIDAAGHAAITFDLWSDQYRRLNYITFTLHYLTTDFELKSFTLCTNLIEGKKTGEKIQDMLNDTKQRFDLQEKVLHSVTDAGSNVKRAISLASLDSHLCLGHGLHNLVTVDGIGSVPELNELVKKCKKIVKTVRYRLPDLERAAEKEQIQLLQSLERASEHLEMDENEPIIDDEESESGSVSELQTNNDDFGSINHVPSIKTSSPTRWHSVLTMLESLAHFCNRNPVNNMLSQVGQHDLKINQHEWNLLEDLIRFLRKFREVVEMLSTQKTASLNLALVFHLEIRDILNSLSDEETLIMLSLKNKMLEKLDKRFPITEKIVVAALLDSRFIGLSQIDSYLELKNTTRAAFLADYIKKQANISAVSTFEAAPSVMATSSNESLLSKLSRKHSSGTFSSSLTSEFNEADQECWKYLAAANASDVVDDDILQYWRDKKKSFPLLSELARAMLSIPATSTPSERVFSVAGLTVTAKRSRLSPLRVNKIIFIHDNYSLCKENCS